jgi:S-methylmethionine-dependent homocysteine/selenocysteine methylase
MPYPISTVDQPTRPWVTDGGLETDLIFHRGIDLPEFAAFPLVEDPAGIATLRSYYDDYVAIAAAAEAGIILETPTWRANADWGTKLGYDTADLARVNRAAVDLLRQLADEQRVDNVRISGVVGPRGDGYAPTGLPADSAAEYHAAQISTFADAGVDFVHAMTVNQVAEAIGVVRAAQAAHVPVAMSFTVETDGRLPDGTTLRGAIEQVDAVAPPDWYGVNCAHPTHLRPALDGGTWQSRLSAFRPNASTLSHAELDEAEDLDTGDRAFLATTTRDIQRLVPSLSILGGCCGTDARHVAQIWGTAPAD